MIHGFEYFSVEEHPLKERLWNAAQWLRKENQSDLEPHTPWVALTWLGYRTLEGKFPFEEFTVLKKSAHLPELTDQGQRCRWECSLDTVLEYLRVLRGLDHEPCLEHARWVRMWPNSIINILRLRALWAAERYTTALIQASDLSIATMLWNDAASRMVPAFQEWPHNLCEHHKAVDALSVITQACWKAAVVKIQTYPAILKYWSSCWGNEWHHKAWRKALEHSNWHP
jgi:hypothetical protein